MQSPFHSIHPQVIAFFRNSKSNYAVVQNFRKLEIELTPPPKYTLGTTLHIVKGSTKFISWTQISSVMYVLSHKAFESYDFWPFTESTHIWKQQKVYVLDISTGYNEKLMKIDICFYYITL